MKILFVANRVPYPPFRGDKLKIFNLAKRLCVHHELHLITFAQSAEDWTYKSELEKIFAKVEFINLPKWKSALNCIGGFFDKTPFQVHYFRHKSMSEAIANLLNEEHFDVIHVQHLRMAQYFNNIVSIPRILDLPDAFSLYWKRKLTNTQNPFLRFFEKIEQKRVYRYEKNISNYNLALVCSQEDKIYLEQEHKLHNLSLLPNGVDTNTFAPQKHDYDKADKLLFTGNMDYGPNVDAVVYFAKQIFPTVLKSFPKVQFIVAGQRPIDKVLALANEQIKVTGFIPQLAEIYNQASVVVAPLRFGAGTQNKVLEAMSMGIPVVCSDIGFVGLGIQSGEGAIMETNPNEFAQKIINLLSSAEARQSVGNKGISVIQSKFSWDIIAQQLEGYFAQLSDLKSFND